MVRFQNSEFGEWYLFEFAENVAEVLSIPPHKVFTTSILAIRRYL